MGFQAGSALQADSARREAESTPPSLPFSNNFRRCARRETESAPFPKNRWQADFRFGMMAAADRMPAASSGAPRGGRSGPVRVHRGRLQQGDDPLGAGLPQPVRVREGRLACGRWPPNGGVKGDNGIGVDSWPPAIRKRPVYARPSHHHRAAAYHSSGCGRLRDWKKRYVCVWLG